MLTSFFALPTNSIVMRFERSITGSGEGELIEHDRALVFEVLAQNRCEARRIVRVERLASQG